MVCRELGVLLAAAPSPLYTSADSGGGVLQPGVWHQVRHRARAGGAGQDCGAGGRHGACTSSWPVRPPAPGTQSVMTPVLQAQTASMESASVTQTPSFPRTPRCRTWRRAPIRGRRAGTCPPCWGRCRSSLWCPGGTSDSVGGREQGVMGLGRLRRARIPGVPERRWSTR